jgi:NADPH:quinone reductase-like Zn-dependent oxidoreductase
MKVALVRRFGGSDVLEWTDTEDPHPKRGEIRVQVRASSINAFECEIREGAFTRPALPDDRWPRHRG